MTKVKICGVRTPENALMVARAGADFIGLNFYPESPRFVEPAVAGEIVARLREGLGASCPKLVGVFVNASAAEVRDIVERVGLDYAQLSGDEPAETAEALAGIAFKSIRPVDVEAALAAAEGLAAAFPQSSDAPSILLDAFNPKLYGGTGETASLRIAAALRAAVPRMMLAGGLNPDNVAERARAVEPWGVDVASGVEAGTPGIKDERAVRAFIQAARQAGS
ncbi:MAG: phosphoribosylanthranilate isomerase [Chloroflexota bacterium]|nr:phosphoribosylanthranilate isomerase [Chloroflexota bacterium]MDE2946963.1 phosphoribosylanthranilate isomerase [Chloroflexota bacterium]